MYLFPQVSRCTGMCHCWDIPSNWISQLTISEHFTEDLRSVRENHKCYSLIVVLGVKHAEKHLEQQLLASETVLKLRLMKDSIDSKKDILSRIKLYKNYQNCLKKLKFMQENGPQIL